MESILYKGKEHFLDGNIEQVSPSGKAFKYVGLKRNENKSSLWVNGKQVSHWIYMFRYINENGGFYINEFNGTYSISLP